MIYDLPRLQTRISKPGPIAGRQRPLARPDQSAADGDQPEIGAEGLDHTESKEKPNINYKSKGKIMILDEEGMNHSTNNILEQITEQQVFDWMQARLESIRTPEFRVNNLSISASHFADCPPRIWVSLHCDGECASSCDTLDQAVEELRNKIGDVSTRAAAKRSEAEKLLREAAELEAGK